MGGPAPVSGSYALQADGARSAMEAFIDGLAAAPARSFSGAGVVIAAGGLDYLTNAWVGVKLLREHGCTLPIQIWHLGAREMPRPLGRLFQAAGVECVDAEARFSEHGVQALGGWALKPFAVVACRFRHVLLLDADNVPVGDPSHLFDRTDYRNAGAVFWPDRQEGTGVPGALLLPNHPIWALTGVAYRGDPSFESGQLCVDKQRCWRELRLALWMNEDADFWYRYLYGDKDTFHIAWRKLGRDWAMPADRPLLLDQRVFSQVDFDGGVLFQHRCGDKWRLGGDNPVIPTFAHEARCREALADLRARCSRRSAWEATGFRRRRQDGCSGAGPGSPRASSACGQGASSTASTRPHGCGGWTAGTWC